MGWKSLIAVTTGFSVGLAILLYTPVPSGYSKPWQVHIAYSSMRLVKLLSGLCAKVGLAESHEVVRAITNTVSKLERRLSQHQNVTFRDAVFDGVRVRIFTPEARDIGHLSPGMMYYHGGGFIIGSVDLYHSLAARLARELNAIVISVEYSLAPENVYPAGFHDCVSATKYALLHGNGLGVDSKRIAIGGDSAGGNLAAAVALKLRDENFEPRVKLQLLFYPSLQSINLLTPSFQENRHHPIMGQKDGAQHMSLYSLGHARYAEKIARNEHVAPEVQQRLAENYLNVGKLPEHDKAGSWYTYVYQQPDLSRYDENLWDLLESTLMSPYFSPLLAQNLSGLPEAYIFTGEYDIVRDDGFWYAGRLREAGVEVMHRHSDIAFHGIFSFHDKTDECSDYLHDIIEFIKNKL